MGVTISGMTGRGSIRHNNRSFSAANIDRSRTGLNFAALPRGLLEVDGCRNPANHPPPEGRCPCRLRAAPRSSLPFSKGSRTASRNLNTPINRNLAASNTKPSNKAEEDNDSTSNTKISLHLLLIIAIFPFPCFRANRMYNE